MLIFVNTILEYYSNDDLYTNLIKKNMELNVINLIMKLFFSCEYLLKFMIDISKLENYTIYKIEKETISSMPILLELIEKCKSLTVKIYQENL